MALALWPLLKIAAPVGNERVSESTWADISSIGVATVEVTMDLKPPQLRNPIATA